jgi:hypothetical protein
MDVLEVFCKCSNDRTGLFLKFKSAATLFRPFSKVSVAKSGRQETTHVLHKEHPWFHYFDKTEELPKHRSARVLNGLSSTDRAERLARWTANEQVKFSGLEVKLSENLVGIERGNVAFKDCKVVWQPSIWSIHPYRFAE